LRRASFESISRIFFAFFIRGPVGNDGKYISPGADARKLKQGTGHSSGASYSADTEQNALIGPKDATCFVLLNERVMMSFIVVGLLYSPRLSRRGSLLWCFQGRNGPFGGGAVQKLVRSHFSFEGFIALVLFQLF
jgi:hypothetical protein